jgi:hypothetical protein
MVIGLGDTVIDCWTELAAEYVCEPFDPPACVVSIVHVPTDTIVTVTDDTPEEIEAVPTVQTPVVNEVNDTCRSVFDPPSFDVAFTEKAASPKVLSAGSGKSIVCEVAVAVTVRVPVA